MSPSINRGRIKLRPLGASYWTRMPQLLADWIVGLKGYDLVAEMRRDETDEEILVRNQRTGIYMGLTPRRTLRTVDTRKVKAALAAIGKGA